MVIFEPGDLVVVTEIAPRLRWGKMLARLRWHLANRTLLATRARKLKIASSRCETMLDNVPE